MIFWFATQILEKALFQKDFALASTHLLPILVYSILTTVLAILVFLGQRKKQ